MDGNKTCSIDIHVTDDGNPTRNTETQASLQVNNAATIVVSGSGGGGGCSIAGSPGDWKDGAGSYGILVLVAIGLAVRRRMRHVRVKA